MGKALNLVLGETPDAASQCSLPDNSFPQQSQLHLSKLCLQNKLYKSAPVWLVCTILSRNFLTEMLEGGK